MIQHKKNIIQKKVLCINTSIAKPIVNIIRANDTYATTQYLELPREECTPKSLLSKNDIIRDLECIYVITPDHEQCQTIFPRWKNLLQKNSDGVTVNNAYRELINKNSINGIPIILIDYTTMILLALAQEEFHKNISKKDTILLCHAGEHKTALISLYNNLIYSTFGFCSSLVEEDDFIQCVDEFQDLRLKDDDVTLIGGCGSAFVQYLPATKQTPILYIIGKRAKKFNVPCTLLNNTEESILIWNTIMFLYSSPL